jgi:nucleoside triphosphate diphosphatase
MTDSRTPEPAKSAGTLTPPAVGETPGEAFAGLVELMRLLRGPGGCPWDHEQTLDTLKPFVLEEAHEVIDAIERRDAHDLRGEIGDLIFEGVFLAQVSADDGGFTITDALRDVHEKLVRRHPHVFANVAGVRTPDHVKGQWEQVKAAERTAAGKPARGVFDGIPKTLPALLAAYEIGQRAAATGFDWQQAADVVDKIEEEVDELRETLQDADRARMEEELGDLLFAVANLARRLKIEPEAALRAANRKFTTRFAAMQQRLEEHGLSLGKASLDQMEHEWQAVKREEGADQAGG